MERNCGQFCVDRKNSCSIPWEVSVCLVVFVDIGFGSVSLVTVGSWYFVSSWCYLGLQRLSVKYRRNEQQRQFQQGSSLFESKGVSLCVCRNGANAQARVTHFAGLDRKRSRSVVIMECLRARLRGKLAEPVIAQLR